MNKFVDKSSGIPRDYFPVTPNNGADNLISATGDIVLGLYITTGGAVVISNDSGVDRTMTFADATFVPFVGAKRVKATGTTATGIFSAII